MTYTPVVNEINVQQAGANNFLYPAGWCDVIQVHAHVEYDLTAARTAMGLKAGQPLHVIFAADGPFWANFHANAAIPSGNTTDGSGSVFSPTTRYLDSSITTISLVSSAAQNVSMEFFRP